MAIDPSEVFVLFPHDSTSASLISAADLMNRLDDDTYGEPTLYDAVVNGAIDQVDFTDKDQVRRVVALNENGDADAYWNP